MGYPHAFIEANDGGGQDFATVGGQGQQEILYPVNVWMVKEEYGGADFTQEEAHRMHSAIVRAVMEDQYRGAIAVDTIPVRWSAFHATSDDPMTGIAVTFDIKLRYARDNPETALPT